MSLARHGDGVGVKKEYFYLKLCLEISEVEMAEIELPELEISEEMAEEMSDLEVSDELIRLSHADHLVNQLTEGLNLLKDLLQGSLSASFWAFKHVFKYEYYTIYI